MWGLGQECPSYGLAAWSVLGVDLAGWVWLPNGVGGRMAVWERKLN